MNSRNKARVQLRNSAKGVPNTPAVIDVHGWRELFKKLFADFPTEKVLYKELGKFDSYYLSRKGGLELYKVKQDLASLAKTARAVKALEKFNSNKSLSRTSRLKRQKLVIPDQA